LNDSSGSPEGITVNITQVAPVIAAAETDIRTPAALTWRILADVGNWPRWNPSVRRVDFSAPITPGREFRWLADGISIVSRLEELSPFRRLVWSGRAPGIRAVHVWSFKESDTSTCVRTKESFEGLLPRLFAKPLRYLLKRSLQQGLLALKTEAERQTHRSVQ
jgi:hypothetical protein